MDLKKDHKMFDGKNVRQHYLQVLTELERTICEGNIDRLRKSSNLIESITKAEDPATLKDYYDNSANPIKNTNLVILACKYNKVKILEHLFDADIKILNNLSVDVGRNTTLPHNEDESHHNAFYYAIRSRNVELLDTLISKWPGNYFAVHLEQLDEILSQAYDELRLKNILLSDEMEIFIEEKLINHRFFSNMSIGENKRQDQHVDDQLNMISERIKLIIENVNLLKAEYSGIKLVDEKFLFVAKFIAQNIHILKRQLKSTYARLPWEEIEFSLVSFVSSHTKRQEINLFYNAMLSKSKILNHLENFAKRLEEEKDIIESGNIDKLANLPKVNRVRVVAEIIKNYPQFEGLYNDYQQISDMYSLQKISDFIKLALSCDPKEGEGQLIITRVLQVIGEYLKNTLESPKLSNSTSELLLLSLPINTRKVIIDLRNSLSHADSLFRRVEIEDNQDVSFYALIQNDINKIGNIITDIFTKNKMKTITMLLKQITNSVDPDEIKGVIEIFNNVELDWKFFENFKMMEHEKIEKMMKELSDNIVDKTNHEKELFSEINKTLNCVGSASKNIRSDYIIGFGMLRSIRISLNTKIDRNIIRGIKFYANNALSNIAPRTESHSLKKIAKLSANIFNSVRSRIQHNDLDKIQTLICDIFYIAKFETGDVKWIEELRSKLYEKGSFILRYKPSRTCNITKEKYKDQLVLKLSKLTSIFSNNLLGSQLYDKFVSYKSDRQLQVVIEMLVLDIMSILDSLDKYLENNLFFLDDNAPLLIGKCLRNHLAHGNALIDVLLSDPVRPVYLNAKKLIEENVMKNGKKIGKSVSDDAFKVKEKYNKSLGTIANLETMFVALINGNLKILKDCLAKGADIHACSTNLRTTLHVAAKGPSCEIIKFLLNQNLSVNSTDINGQTPLHIAAAHGRKHIVEFLTKEANVLIDVADNCGQTPLHIAAQNGHKDVVEVLLKNKADRVIHDKAGHLPLHHAIANHHIDVAIVLLEKDANVDINTIMSNFTPLHVAAERGLLELVNFLLQNQADVNARTDRDYTPIHAAALNGYLQVVNILISKGAHVNATVIDGCTPLHYAVENGHEKIVNILLKHGANVNTFDKTYRNTPLHYAAQDGHEKIVRILLKNEANSNIATVVGITPLHFAAQGSHLEIAAILLKHGAKMYAKDVHNATPLHYAAKSGSAEVADHLIKSGSKVNAKTNNNFTPLHEAALQGHKDVTDLLLRNNAGINAEDITGCTALHAAARGGSKDVIDLLLQNKAQVNKKGNDGTTPLHAAVINGHEDIIVLLLQNKAEVNARTNYDCTPLHFAAIKGHKNIVNLLIKNKAQLDASYAKMTPLHVAVEAGHREIVEILIANGANVNVKYDSLTPLLSAIKSNHKEIVEVLVANGADVNAESGKPLLLAVIAGYRDIVNILLESKADLKVKNPENATLLHLAAKRGHKEIVSALIQRGAVVNATTINNTTSLYFAAQEGHEEVVELLIANNANVNILNRVGTPLHIAAGRGHGNVVKVLLSREAEINIKDNKGRTAFQLAVAHGHLQVVKMFMNHQKIDVNIKDNYDRTVLHIAAQENNLTMVTYLVDNGFDINARNESGSKPVHIAAREGYKDTVEFFLKRGLSVTDRGIANQTLLHYAAIQDHVEVVEYLITQGADVNDKDANGLTPVHISAKFGCKNVIKILLKNGAIYNAIDRLYRKPLAIAKNKDVINLLATTEELFEVVKHNNSSDVKICIEAGAFVNVKNADSATPLHYAAWKGYEQVVNILLQNGANPNVVGGKRVTPLHYAAKFSHLRIVKALLSNGAVYNAVSDGGKTPLDFATDKSIVDLFKLVTKAFKNVKNDNFKVITDLKKIKDIDILKAIMTTRDSENKTLIVAAVQNNFSNIKQLEDISQGDISVEINIGKLHAQQGNYQEALSILKSAYEKRKGILGPDNPATLNIQKQVAIVLYKQGTYEESLNMLKDIFHEQNASLGCNDEDTLDTRGAIALVLHRQGKNEEAIDIYQEVYQRQKEILGLNHSDALNTQFHMALVLDKLGRYEEALIINRAVFENRKNIFGRNDPHTISAENNIAMVLASQGKYDEALKIYKEVFEKKKLILGIRHSDTLRTLHNIAGILAQQKKYNEASKAFQEALVIQKDALGQNHPDTLNTQYNLANLFFAQGKQIDALKAYHESFDRRKAIYGSNHPTILDTLNKIKIIKTAFNSNGNKISDILEYLQKDMNIAASNGDIQTVQRLLQDGINANDKDIEGRTPLHYAVTNGYIDVVNLLLENGADVTQVTNKGNTSLHIAASKSYKKIIETLLQRVSHDKLNDFINAKTVVAGTTSLHVAAKSGSIEVTKCLLKHGASYDIENKEGKTPIDLAEDDKVIYLLKLIKESFEDAKNGNVEMISKLTAVKPDEFVAATSARNTYQSTLVQVAIHNKHTHIAFKLLEMLKRNN